MYESGVNDDLQVHGISENDGWKLRVVGFFSLPRGFESKDQGSGVRETGDRDENGT